MVFSVLCINEYGILVWYELSFKILFDSTSLSPLIAPIISNRWLLPNKSSSYCRKKCLCIPEAVLKIHGTPFSILRNLRWCPRMFLRSWYWSHFQNQSGAFILEYANEIVVIILYEPKMVLYAITNTIK